MKLLISGSKVRVLVRPPFAVCALCFARLFSPNCPASYPRWTFICSPSALDQLRHRLARQAFAVGSFGVALHLAQRSVAEDRRNLVCTTADLGETPRCRF